LKSGSHDVKIEQQLESKTSCYLMHILISKEADNPLLFGKLMVPCVHPQLSILAREYLGILSSSVPVECTFSTTGLVMNSKRSCLNPVNMNMITFIHDNIHS
jgi:hypothetical protein